VIVVIVASGTEAVAVEVGGIKASFERLESPSFADKKMAARK